MLYTPATRLIFLCLGILNLVVCGLGVFETALIHYVPSPWDILKLLLGIAAGSCLIWSFFARRARLRRRA
jgi:hypothetical protein